MSTVENDLHVDQEHDSDTAVAPFSRRAPRISQADVFQAADALLLNGDRPTIDRVRMRLGRGSPNTINDHLDAWWSKLGARLRDLPGQEFPQLPERVATSLQQLWTAALEGAHEVLRTTLSEREAALHEAEQRQAAQAAVLSAQSESVEARAAAIEASVELMHEQLSAAVRRTEALDQAVQARDALLGQARTHAEGLERASADLRAQLSAIETAHRQERTRWHDQHAAAEAHWLNETDRARQAHKDSEREGKVLLGRVSQLTDERDRARLELTEVRGALRALESVRTVERAASGRTSAGPKRKTSRARTRVRKASPHTR